MFNVIRTDEIPESLKKRTRYDGQDVFDKLKEIFHDKCYICETKSPQDVNVEHFDAHINDLDKKFSWDNLYFVCSRCNNIKGSKYNNLIDCCDKDEDVYRALQLLPPYTPFGETIIVKARINSDKVKATVNLLDKVYNGKSSVNKSVSGGFLREKIFESLNPLLDLIRIWHSRTSLPHEREDAIERMKLLISPDAQYSAFMRDVLLDDAKLKYLIEELEL